MGKDLEQIEDANLGGTECNLTELHSVPPKGFISQNKNSKYLNKIYVKFKK